MCVIVTTFMCFSTQPGHGAVGMLWIGDLLISSCITVTLIKRWNMLLHTLNNSQMYFRDIPIDYLKQVPITSGHVLLQGNSVNCTKVISGYLGPLLLCL